MHSHAQTHIMKECGEQEREESTEKREAEGEEGVREVTTASLH